MDQELNNLLHQAQREGQSIPSPSADFEQALRPLRFEDFAGQDKVVQNLSVFVEAAKYRGDHFRPCARQAG